MTQHIPIHPADPQPRVLAQVARCLKEGGLVAVPTECSYVLACLTGNKEAQEKLRLVRGVDERHHFTLMCRDLSEIATYARVDNAQYRFLKAATPGSYTFILEGTKELPRRVVHPKRKTIGLRVPDFRVVRALLEALGEPILTSTLIVAGDEGPMTEGWEIADRLDGQLDMVVDAGSCSNEVTTVIDLTSGVPELFRLGKGPLAPLGLV